MSVCGPNLLSIDADRAMCRLGYFISFRTSKLYANVYSCTFRIRDMLAIESDPLVIVAFKNPNSYLREVIKTVKYHYDNPDALRRYETILRRALFLENLQSDSGWHGEALHQLALLCEIKNDLAAADKFYVEALDTFADYERLGMARTLRDYGLFVATHHDPRAGLGFVEQALALHDDDLNNRKGRRQRRITESYLWRAKLLVDSEDEVANRALIEYALYECKDCFIRDQQQAVSAALTYASGVQKSLLEARMIPIYASRNQLTGVITSMAKFVIDTEVYVVGRFLRYMIRRE